MLPTGSVLGRLPCGVRSERHFITMLVLLLALLALFGIGVDAAASPWTGSAGAWPAR
ncbi:MAG TPA: hypothetical protein VFD39_11640 [Trueperaceae bacterium]|nr:hypothetical protein [Trueperaceae bacterium]